MPIYFHSYQRYTGWKAMKPGWFRHIPEGGMLCIPVRKRALTQKYSESPFYMTEAGKIFWEKLNISGMYSSMEEVSRMSSTPGRGICWKRLLIRIIPFLSACFKRPGEKCWWKISIGIEKER